MVTRLETTLEKQSDSHITWNSRCLRIFSDRVEYGCLGKSNTFVQKAQKGKSPISFNCIISFEEVGSIGFILRVFEGPAHASRSKSFRCTSRGQRAAILAALKEISEATLAADVKLQKAVRSQNPEDIVSAMEEASKYAIDLSGAEVALRRRLKQSMVRGLMFLFLLKCENKCGFKT